MRFRQIRPDRSLDFAGIEAKPAQLAVSRGLAETLAGTGVTVKAILPGLTRSE